MSAFESIGDNGSEARARRDEIGELFDMGVKPEAIMSTPFPYDGPESEADVLGTETSFFATEEDQEGGAL